MLLLCLVALSKVPESVLEGEDKEADSSEEKVVPNPPVKEEVETPEVKVETPELKVNNNVTMTNHNTCDNLFFGHVFKAEENVVSDWTTG